MRRFGKRLFLFVFLSLCLASHALVIRPRLVTTSLRNGQGPFVLRLGSTAKINENKEPLPEPQGGGTASIPTLSVSLVKSIVGGGVLAIPSGVAALATGSSSTPASLESVLPVAVATILASGTLNAYYFSLVGVVCETTQATSYNQAWERTVGPATAPLVTAVVTGKTALSCLAYSMILADSGVALAQAAGWADVTRSEALVAVTTFILVPLTLRRNLTALAPFSLVGLVGVGITTATIVTRFRDGSYIPGTGMFVSHPDVSMVLTTAAGSSTTMADTAGSWPGVVLVCTLATAFVAHYNAPRFYQELREASLSRFQVVTATSYVIATILFVVVGIAGFLTFGAASQGYILNNYATSDSLATFAKTALTGSILLTYPLPFVGLRDGTWDLLGVQNRENLHVVTTLALLALITAAATAVQDLALVLSVGGGTFSTAVSAVFPVCMYLAMESEQKSVLGQVGAALGMLLSIGIGVEGVHLSLLKAAAATEAAAAAVATSTASSI